MAASRKLPFNKQNRKSVLLLVVALIFFAHYILEWWNKDKSLARKQLNDGVAIFSHIYDEWKAASSKQ